MHNPSIERSPGPSPACEDGPCQQSHCAQLGDLQTSLPLQQDWD